jgi:hypothetical protein
MKQAGNGVLFCINMGNILQVRVELRAGSR